MRGFSLVELQRNIIGLQINELSGIHFLEQDTSITHLFVDPKYFFEI